MTGTGQKKKIIQIILSKFFDLFYRVFNNFNKFHIYTVKILPMMDGLALRRRKTTIFKMKILRNLRKIQI